MNQPSESSPEILWRFRQEKEGGVSLRGPGFLYTWLTAYEPHLVVHQSEQPVDEFLHRQLVARSSAPARDDTRLEISSVIHWIGDDNLTAIFATHRLVIGIVTWYLNNPEACYFYNFLGHPKPPQFEPPNWVHDRFGVHYNWQDPAETLGNTEEEDRPADAGAEP